MGGAGLITSGFAESPLWQHRLMSTGLLANTVVTKNKKRGTSNLPGEPDASASRCNFHADSVMSLLLLLPQG